MINKNFLFIIGIFFTFSLLLIPAIKNTFAQTVTSLINATVKVSICGDDLIEGNEDCEGADLNGQSCTTLGYGEGNLTCDIACSFDTTSCFGSLPTATPTLTPTSAPANTSTPTPISVPSSTSTTSTSTPTPTTLPAVNLQNITVPIITPALPLPVIIFDIDGSGKLETTEVYLVVKDWIEQWRGYLQGQFEVQEKRKCDINRDQSCNLFDFSILMYYVER